MEHSGIYYNMSYNNPNPARFLTAAANIATPGNIFLFKTPRSLLPITIILYVTDSDCTVSPTISIGTNSPNFDNILGQLVPTIVLTDDRVSYTVTNDTIAVSPGNSIYLKVHSGSDGSEILTSIGIFGMET